MLFENALFRIREAISWRRLDSGVVGHILTQVDAKAIRPQYTDLWWLYRAVREHAPHVIWEFGAGWSTAFLAQAVADNGFGRVISMDADERWAEHARRLVPPWLQAEIRFAPAAKVEVRGEPAWRHSNRPDDALPQFIYIDGPAGSGECPGFADLVDIEDQLEPGCLVVIDGRPKTSAMLRRTLRRDWRYWEERGPLGVKPIQRKLQLVR